MSSTTIVNPDSTCQVTLKNRPLEPPPRYHLILNNDDYTPMDFVIEVLQKFFSYSSEQATQLMLRVHHEGRAICGIFTFEVAETKAFQLNQYARAHQHPLLCTLEPAT